LKPGGSTGHGGGRFQHFSSLRRMKNDHCGYTRFSTKPEMNPALDTFIIFAKPSWLERPLVLIVQAISTILLLLYLILPEPRTGGDI